MLRTALKVAAVVFVVYYLATDPAGAAHFVRSAEHGLEAAGHSLSVFVSKL
jgi:hypothetical protein